jgi:hypothetical protein
MTDIDVRAFYFEQRKGLFLMRDPDVDMKWELPGGVTNNIMFKDIALRNIVRDQTFGLILKNINTYPVVILNPQAGRKNNLPVYVLSASLDPRWMNGTSQGRLKSGYEFCFEAPEALRCLPLTEDTELISMMPERLIINHMEKI